MSRQYLTQARLQGMADRLGPRDWGILDSLAQVRLASARQLEHLHFGGLSPRSRARIRRRVLARLTDQRLLARLDRRIGGVRAGSSGYVYTLGLAGQRLVLDGGVTGRRPRKPWTPSRAFVDHRLGVTQRFIELKQAEGAGQLQVLAFESEPESWRPLTGLDRRQLKPDAFVRAAVGEWEELVFVEYDRGTEGPAQLRRQLDAYWQYYLSGHAQADAGVFPRVLWLADHRDRVAWMTDVAARQPPDRWRLHQVIPSERFIDALINTNEKGGTP